MERMFRLLNADEIECRVSTISDEWLSLLLYKDARVDQNLLDATVGPDRWQRNHEVINGNLFCNVGIKFGDAWVWKQDVGTESNTEKEKGQASDAFKRACFNWGIGRELYTAPRIRIYQSDKSGKNYTPYIKNGRPSTTDRFIVTRIKYTESGSVCELEIKNAKSKKTVFAYSERKIDQPEKQTEEPKENAKQEPGLITGKQMTNLQRLCSKHNMPESNIYERYGHTAMWQMTVSDYVELNKVWQAIFDEWDKDHQSQEA